MRILIPILLLLLALLIGGGYYVYSYQIGDSIASVNINDTEIAKVGTVVIHQKFGAGEVLNIQAYELSTTIHIDFGGFGKKWLVVDEANLQLQN